MEFSTYTDHLIRLIAEHTPNVISAVLVLVIGLWLIKRVANIANRTMEKRDLEVSLRTFLKSLISIGLKVVLIVTVAGMIGVGTASFVTILGAAGLAVGLALQGSLSNFAGGVLLLIFKPYKVGDLIEVQGHGGEVKEIQIFNTILLTSDHKTIILPNGSVSNGVIVNNSRHGDLRVDLQVAVSSSNNIDKVKEIILKTVLAQTIILQDPAPSVSVSKTGDGAVVLNIRPYAKTENYWDAHTIVQEAVKKALELNNIVAPIPQRIIHNA